VFIRAIRGKNSYVDDVAPGMPHLLSTQLRCTYFAFLFGAAVIGGAMPLF